MSRRDTWLSVGLVAVVALAVRIWAATQVTFPQPEDTAYYVDVARNLLSGHGLVADAIWSYNTPPLTFSPPRPAFEVWLPLPTFLAAIPMALFGGVLGSFAAAQVESIVVGTLVCVLAWRLGLDVAEDLELPRERAMTLAIGAGLASAVYLPLVLFSVQPDSTMPFAALVLIGVLLARRILRAITVLAPAPEAPRFKFRRDRRPARSLAAARGGAPASGGGARASAGTPAGGASTRAGGGTPAGGGTRASGGTPASGGTRAARKDARRAPASAGKRAGDASDGRPLLLDDRARWLLIGLGVVIGLAAWTRNDALWLALMWAIVAWRATAPAGGWQRRLRAAMRLIGWPALASIVVFLPWALRDWAVFGNPLPGQAALNALFLDGRDVFAWAEPPTLERYLNAGPAALLGLRVTGLVHNLGSVLLLLGVPISAVGLLGLPSAARVPSLRPLIGFALIAFLVATLVFPVATTWGTFLHAAGAIHVLILISALLVLDRFVDRVRARQGWTRPVAWLGPAAAVVMSLFITVVLVPPQGADGRAIEARYASLPAALAAAGAPLPTDGSPVITDFPIWLATEDSVHALALPNEIPAEVLDLANHFGAKLLIVDQSDEGQWPEILDQESPGSECFSFVPLTGPGGASLPDDSPLANTVVFKIVCAGSTNPGTP
jgi:hypothetical protein